MDRESRSVRLAISFRASHICTDKSSAPRISHVHCSSLPRVLYWNRRRHARQNTVEEPVCLHVAGVKGGRNRLAPLISTMHAHSIKRIKEGYESCEAKIEMWKAGKMPIQPGDVYNKKSERVRVRKRERGRYGVARMCGRLRAGKDIRKRANQAALRHPRRCECHASRTTLSHLIHMFVHLSLAMSASRSWIPSTIRTHCKANVNIV